MTKAERQWCDAIIRMGCVVCVLRGHGASPAEVHHLKSGGRRTGHENSIPLCYDHHRSGRRDAEVVSRHPWGREFERRYGPEESLLTLVRERVVAPA